MMASSKTRESAHDRARHHKLSDDELASEVAKANATMEELKASGENHSAWLRARFEKADLVLGYWQILRRPVRQPALLKGAPWRHGSRRRGREALGILRVQASYAELAAMAQFGATTAPRAPSRPAAAPPGAARRGPQGVLTGLGLSRPAARHPAGRRRPPRRQIAGRPLLPGGPPRSAWANRGN